MPVFFFKQKTAYEMLRSLVGSEMCIRDRKGTDTQPLSTNGNIPWVDRDFDWRQHNVNLTDTWTMSATMINQLRATYMRQFGGRVNNPTTSLADLGSKFTPQGDPTLPRITVNGYF